MSTLYTKDGFNDLQNLLQTINYNNNFVNNEGISVSVGRVFGVVTTINTPTEAQFNRAGGYSGVGTVFFKNYLSSKNETLKEGEEDDFFALCQTATPLFPNVSHFPLIGELIYLLYLSSPDTQTNSVFGHFYYLSPLNLWGNSSVNSQSPEAGSKLGRTFIENPNIKNILNFEGDHIIQGRKGNSIRLGTTVKKLNYLNEWSDFGVDGDPITIISNDPIRQASSSSYYIENINNPGVSSIYLTSTQRIPLKVSKSTSKFSTKLNVIEPNQYYSGSQVILNADRIVLNTKEDHLLFYSKKNIELTTSNTIMLNADNYIHLNIKPEIKTKFNLNVPKIFLGTLPDGNLPDEPLVLGDKLDDFLSELIELINKFAIQCTATALPPPGSPLTKLEAAADSLRIGLTEMYNKIEGLKSKSNFTI